MSALSGHTNGDMRCPLSGQNGHGPPPRLIIFAASDPERTAIVFSDGNRLMARPYHHNFYEHPRSPKVGREASPHRRLCRIDPLVPNRIVIFEKAHICDPNLGAKEV